MRMNEDNFIPYLQPSRIVPKIKIKSNKIKINKILYDLNIILNNDKNDNKLNDNTNNNGNNNNNNANNNDNNALNEIIIYIVSCLKKDHDDHLLSATAIWALINIFRIEPQKTK